MDNKPFHSPETVAIPVSATDIEPFETCHNAGQKDRSAEIRSFRQYVFQDAKANSPKIRCFLVLFRLASFFEIRKRSIACRAMYYLTNLVYCLFADLFVGGAELPAGTRVGRNLTIHHGYGLVIGKEVWIKDNVILRQGVTIGNYLSQTGKVIGNPIIESFAEFGAGACVLGNTVIGERAFIGANAVVYKNIAARTRVYPGRCVTREHVGREASDAKALSQAANGRAEQKAEEAAAVA